MGLLDFFIRRKQQTKEAPVFDPEDVPKEVLDRLIEIKESDRARPHHYHFAYIVFRGMVYDEPLQMMVLLSGERGNDFLIDVWKDFGEHVREDTPQVDPEGLHVAIAEWRGDLFAVVVAFPTPERSNECYYAAILVGPVPDDPPAGSVEIGSIPVGYYTLERCFPGFIEGPVAPVVGFWYKDDTRENYGDGPEPGDPEAFLQHVLAIHYDRPTPKMVQYLPKD